MFALIIFHPLTEMLPCINLCYTQLLSLFPLQLILTPHKNSLFPLWTHFHITHLNELWQTPNGLSPATFTRRCWYVYVIVWPSFKSYITCWWETTACSNSSQFQRIRGWWTRPTSWGVPLPVPVSLSTDRYSCTQTHTAGICSCCFRESGQCRDNKWLPVVKKLTAG